MAVYRQVHTSFWTDSIVEDHFTPEDKLFYLWVMTNDRTNICGCYEVGHRAMEHELGYSWESIQKLLVRFEKTYNVIRYCEETHEILVLNFGKYNWSKSPKLLKSVLTAAQGIKNDEFREFVITKVQDVTGVKETATNEPYAPKTDSEREFGKVMSYYMDRINSMGPSHIATASIQKYLETMNADVLITAMAIALDEHKTGWSFINGILKNWNALNVHTMADVERVQQARNNSRSGSSTEKALGFAELGRRMEGG